MDGNNRWSKKNNVSKYISYKKGANKLLNLSEYLFANTNVSFISAFALSKDNTNRSQLILKTIKMVLSEGLDNFLNNKKKFDIKFIGDFSFFNNEIKNKINRINSISNYNKKLCIFINYSGKQDIEHAAKNFKGSISNFKNNLLTKSLPDPDLLIRTGGFKRLSNFLLYQISFTELFFLKKLWPDLTISDLNKILIEYKSIKRKFGR